MNQQNLLKLAKQGDSQAIASLIEKALGDRHIKVKAAPDNQCLHLLLEANNLPDRETCIRGIRKQLQRIQPSSINTVTIYGRRNGEKLPDWSHTIEGFSNFKSVSNPSQAKQSKTKKTNSQPWLFVSAIAFLLIPISGLFLNSQKTASTPRETSPEFQIASSSLSPTQLLPNQSPFSETANLEISQNSEIPIETTQQIESDSETISSTDPNTTITIKAVGDIILGTNFPYNDLPSNKQILFQSVKPLLQNADIVFGNFESTLTDYPYTIKNVNSGAVYAFRTPPSFAPLLQDAGFDVLNIANNHSYDFDEEGFQDTMTNINRLGMQAVGVKGQIVYEEVKGVTVAFIGFSNYSHHNSILDFEGTKRIIREADQRADIVVISIHAGAEGTSALHIRNETEYFYGENRGNKVLFAEVAMNAGADLILAHGPHVPRALELYNGKLIAYSLGNFVGYRTLSTAGEKGYSLVLEAKLNAQGDFISGKIHPVRLNGDGVPYPDGEGKSISLIRYLTQSDFPNTPLEIDANGNIYKK